LLIVKNYTGDRLNFGLAAERARAFGLNVEVVIVDDDIALPELPQARGLAGTLFVHKIAGALAENGASLEEVAAAAKRIANGTKTIGMSLDTCSVPGTPKEERIPSGKAELGLGIHGEAGVEQVAFTDARSAMTSIIEKLKYVVSDTTGVVALLNNLGGSSVLEMSVLARELLRSEVGSKIKYVVGPDTLMTSLDMHGFSVSIFSAISEDICALQSATSVEAWPGMKAVGKSIVKELPDGLRPVRPVASNDPKVRDFITKCCELLLSAEDDLNSLDAKSGDGDTGSTLAGAAKALLNSLDRLPLADHTQLYRAIGQELSETMGGSSGVLLAIFFTAAGDAASGGANLRESLQAGLQRMQQIGGANVGDRTMIDALDPAIEQLQHGISAAASAARAGANRTAEMLSAKAGRAAYINSEQLKGNIDPGAEAVARLFEGLR
jgi:dihydroxyacetone kinase